jgi:putative ABC transport system ATP-binding protein
MSLISLKDVYKTYSLGKTSAIAAVHALDGVSFSIEAGEFLSIMGPSGSGKSTCMNMIGCLDRPTAGDIRIDGVNTAQMDETKLAVLRNKTIGFVFQQYHLIANLSVLENVMLPLRYQGLPVHERKERAREVLNQVGLGDRLKHRPYELSGGQKQRVAIARATVTRPAIILADEPTGALDSETGQSVINLFETINQNGTTIIIVTHDPDIGNAARRCIHIRDGKITEDECV